MSTHRHRIRAAMDRTFVTDAGLETWLVFQQGIDLRDFAAFELLGTEAGRQTLRTWYLRFADIARETGHALLLESPTWRANPDWGRRLGYDRDALADVNRAAIGLLLDVRAQVQNRQLPVVVCGNIGPRGDGYLADRRMSVDEAEAYHREQIATFAATEADLVSVFTMNYAEEAIGVVRAARAEGMPVVPSFTVETDGRLPSGQTLAEAITLTDAATGAYALHYMINCAHPTHFDEVLQSGEAWCDRIGGVRPNASCRSHAELEVSTELDPGDPVDLAGRYLGLRRVLRRMRVIGGCCGTDDRHVAEMARLFVPAQA